MYWITLILGVALWWAAHLFQRVAPARRARLGDAGKGLVAVLIVGAIALMIVGYRGVPEMIVWQLPAFSIHINNLLMLIALFLMSPAAKRGRVLQGMRHPMLAGFGTWAVAHLLVNGDVASMILFGGLLAWAIVQPRLINAAEPDWQAPEGGSYAKDLMFLVGSVILLAIIGYIHNWLGVWPFPV